MLVLAVIPLSLFSQTSWISDEEMKFKILAPDNYQKNQFWEGTDKILALVSPDQNVAVRVRAFQAKQQVTTDLIQRFPQLRQFLRKSGQKLKTYET